MTVESTTTKATHNGNDVATSFAFSFTIYASTDLQVVKRSTAGAETVLTEGSGIANYSVSVSSYPGNGTITYPASGTGVLATGERLVIRYKGPELQETDLDNQGGYFADVQETQYDKIVKMILRRGEELDRTLKFAITDSAASGYDLTIPALADQGGYFLQVTDAEDGFALVQALDAGSLAVSAYIETLLNDADAATARTTLGLANHENIVVDSSGRAVNVLQPSFTAYLGTAMTNVTGAGQVVTITYDTEEHDRGSNFNTSTHAFTAPVAGVYQFFVGVRLAGVVSTHTVGQLLLVTSNTSFSLYNANPYAQQASGDLTISGAIQTYMDAADTAYVTLAVGTSDTAVDVQNTLANTYFMGRLLG